jgi:hypothetical protein
VVHQNARHLARRGDVIDHAGLARAARHAVEIRALFILAEHEPAGVVDVADTAGTVTTGTRQHDPNRARPHVLGQGAEENVDRQGERLRLALVTQQQSAARDDHLLARRDQVNAVGLDVHVVLDQQHGDASAAGEQLVHHALEVGREVLHDDERHSRVLRHGAEQLFECVEPAGGSADADYRKLDTFHVVFERRFEARTRRPGRALGDLTLSAAKAGRHTVDCLAVARSGLGGVAVG